MAINRKAWFNKAFITIQQKGETEVQMTAKTTSLGISGGGFDIETIDTFAGQIQRPNVRDDIELTFDEIPTSTQDLDWIFHGVNSTTNTITSSSIKDYRITYLWTNATGITSATQAVTGNDVEAYRQSYVGLNNTSLEYNMDAGEHLTAPIVFKTAFEDSTGSANFKKETKPTSTATLSSMSSYSGSTKF